MKLSEEEIKKLSDEEIVKEIERSSNVKYSCLLFKEIITKVRPRVEVIILIT